MRRLRDCAGGDMDSCATLVRGELLLAVFGDALGAPVDARELDRHMASIAGEEGVRALREREYTIAEAVALYSMLSVGTA